MIAKFAHRPKLVCTVGEFLAIESWYPRVFSVALRPCASAWLILLCCLVWFLKADRLSEAPLLLRQHIQTGAITARAEAAGGRQNRSLILRLAPLRNQHDNEGVKNTAAGAVLKHYGARLSIGG